MELVYNFIAVARTYLVAPDYKWIDQITDASYRSTKGAIRVPDDNSRFPIDERAGIPGPAIRARADRGSISAKCIVIRRLPRRRVLQVHCALFRRSDGTRYTGPCSVGSPTQLHTRTHARTRTSSKQLALVPSSFFFCVFVRRFTVRAPSALCVSHRPWGVPQRLAGLCQRGGEREEEKEKGTEKKTERVRERGKQKKTRKTHRKKRWQADAHRRARGAEPTIERTRACVLVLNRLDVFTFAYTPPAC